jgi:hypothetical protein
MQCLTAAPRRALREAAVSSSISWQASALRAKTSWECVCRSDHERPGKRLAVAVARPRSPIVVAAAAAGRVPPPAHWLDPLND